MLAVPHKGSPWGCWSACPTWQPAFLKLGKPRERKLQAFYGQVPGGAHHHFCLLPRGMQVNLACCLQGCEGREVGVGGGLAAMVSWGYTGR